MPVPADLIIYAGSNDAQLCTGNQPDCGPARFVPVRSQASDWRAEVWNGPNTATRFGNVAVHYDLQWFALEQLRQSDKLVWSGACTSEFYSEEP